MNPVIDNNDRRLPYELSEERFEALHDRIRGQIARRAAATDSAARPSAARPSVARSIAARNPAAAPVRRSLLGVSLGFAVAAVVAAGIVTVCRLRQPVAAEPCIEGLLSTASAETLQQAAAENYDDIFYNQQL